MHDYTSKRRYRQQKLNRDAFGAKQRIRERERRKVRKRSAQGPLPPLKTIVNSENLIRVYYELQRHGGQASGPDRITYDGLSKREVCRIMRQLSQQIIAGRYQPSQARTVRIRKANGGHRTLNLRSIVYRVVAAAVTNALGPDYERRFLSGSHGYRPHRGVSTMLLALEQIVAEQQRFVIAQDDIKACFDHIPIAYVREILERDIAAPDLLTLVVEKILAGHPSEQRTVGIDQGSPLSPLMMNVALHHALDLPFSEQAAHPPWLRYADNLVYPSRCAHEGTAAVQAAQELLKPIGMTLKGQDGKPVDIREEPANILGLALRWENGQIEYDLTEEPWSNLEQALSEANAGTSPAAAEQAVAGWMEAYGPAFEGKRDEPALDRILETAVAAGYREISRHRLKSCLQSSKDRWAHKKDCARRVLMGIKGERKGRGAPLTTDRPGISTCPRPAEFGPCPF